MGHTSTENMRTFSFTLLAVLSCIAMIGATPIGNRAPAEAIVRRQLYVPWQQLMEVLTRLKILSPAALICFLYATIDFLLKVRLDDHAHIPLL